LAQRGRRRRLLVKIAADAQAYKAQFWVTLIVS
jgi:hypothetical protein